MVECNLAKVEVAGSNPVSRSIYFCPCSPEGWSEGFSFDPFPLRKRLTIDTQHSRVRLTTVLLRSHSIDEHIFTFMKKARRNPGLFHFVAEEKSGEGRGNLSEERFPLPSPGTPSSLPPKTFDLIESLPPVSPQASGTALCRKNQQSSSPRRLKQGFNARFFLKKESKHAERKGSVMGCGCFISTVW